MGIWVSGLVIRNQLTACHCEPVTDVTGVAIRTPSGQVRFLRILVPPAGGLPRQCAHWLAMTGESRVKPTHIWVYCAAGRGLPLPLRWIMHVHDLTHSLFIICIFRQIVKSAQAFD